MRPRSKVVRYLRRHGLYTGRLNRVAYYSERDDLPEIPRPDEISVAGSLSAPKWAVIDCPCGYGHTILLPLQATVRPHWRIELDAKARVSLAPSIDRDDRVRRCHFWIKESRIEWVSEKH